MRFGREKNMSETLKDRRSEKGFSLIELIVVLVILGLLAAIVAPKVVGKLGESKSKIAKIQIAEFESTLEAFMFDLGRYPTTAEGLESLIHNPTSTDAWAGPYLKKNLVPLDPWGKPYVYRCPGQHGDVDLFSLGPDGTEGNDDDVCNWKQ
jgi:general secretion pathway protein G